ncbi:MAG: sigma-70 family RNA polymerase sigma factor [Chloroflexi bacterium]|nr:sigma-70 family RNA polymerase sigma factor [Chloroflexota bacterium]
MSPAPPDVLPVAEERALVARAGRGDAASFGRLYDAYLPGVYRYCLGRVGRTADAEDLAAEVFLKVLQSLDRFKWRHVEGSDRSPFRSWLYRIAHNHVASFHRRAYARLPTAELSEAIEDERRGPSELAETKLGIEEAFAAVRLLPDAQREVVLLRFGAGLSVAETAATLGKNETNVKVLQHKGIKGLRRLMSVDLPAVDASR